MPDLISIHASDNYRMARSKHLINNADGVYNLIRIPHFAFVKQIWAQVLVPYSGGTLNAGTMLIGFTGNGETADPDAFVDSAFDVEVAGMYNMYSDAAVSSKGKWFSAGSGMLTATIETGDHTTLLSAYIFMEFTVLH